MVYAAAIATVLFYAANVPLCFAFFVRMKDGVKYGYGIAPFRASAALARAYAFTPGVHFSQKARALRLPAKFILFAAMEIIRRIESVCVRARLGTGDAASTAMLCGTLLMLLSAIGKADVAPVFDSAQLELSGIVEIRAGNIIRAMAAAGVRARPWERKN